jgi:predicted nucleic acid-binding protein
LKRIVIDASVVLKWYLDDEDNGRSALSLLERYVSQELDIIAPSLLGYEVINGLAIANKRGRIRADKLQMAVQGFMDLEISQKHISSFYPKVIHFYNIYNLSAYDASYLALADEESIPLITADERLYNTVKKDLPWIKLF